MAKKPYEAEHPRRIYPNQERVEKRIRAHLLSTSLAHPFVDEVKLMGSLAFGWFGVFDTPEMKHPENPKYASDVDLLITADESYQVPEDWNFEHPFIFFDVYDPGTLEGIKGIKDNVHDISAWVYHPSQANEPPRLPDKIIEHWRKTEDCRLDFTTRKEHLEWQLANHPNKLWYKKLSKSL